MIANRRMALLLFPLVLALLLAGCGPLVPVAGTPEADVPGPTAASLSPLPTATSTPAREPIDLVVLHTNDNWGETDPCG